MDQTRLHLHSMVVHSVVALTVLAAGAFVLLATGVRFAGRGAELWTFLLSVGLIGVAAMAVPATLTGISDRNHMYATWHTSHRIKLVGSLLLLILVAAELMALARAGGVVRLLSWLGAAVVVGNLVVVATLTRFGLQITLGRQDLGTTSYVPDMRRDPPRDILEEVAAAILEPPRSIDPSEEPER